MIFSRQDLRIIRNLYGEETLAQTNFIYQENRVMQLDICSCGYRIDVSIDGKNVLSASDDQLKSGGAGMYLDYGCAGFGRFAIEADITEF